MLCHGDTVLSKDRIAGSGRPLPGHRTAGLLSRKTFSRGTPWLVRGDLSAAPPGAGRLQQGDLVDRMAFFDELLAALDLAALSPLLLDGARGPSAYAAAAPAAALLVLSLAALPARTARRSRNVPGFAILRSP